MHKYTSSNINSDCVFLVFLQLSEVQVGSGEKFLDIWRRYASNGNMFRGRCHDEKEKARLESPRESTQTDRQLCMTYWDYFISMYYFKLYYFYTGAATKQ